MTAESSFAAQVAVGKAGIDLTTAVLNSSNASNPLVNGAIEIGQWLGREKLNRHELADCLSKAKDLARPNELGMKFCSKVKEGGLKNPIAHVFLIQSGSLGRMLVGDPWLCWIVSTTAALFQFHIDSSIISDAICTFIMCQFKSPETLRDDFSLRYRPDRVQTKSVVDRIVSSVWLNVVNAGHKTVKLPEELNNICPRGHLLPSANLGKVMHALQNGKSRVILQSEHFLANIALWLVLHHDGLLRVVVSGKTVYEKWQGQSKSEIELRISKFCSISGPCVENEVLRYEVLEDLKDGKSSLHSGTYDPISALQPTPGIRRALYDIPRAYGSESRASKVSFRHLTQHTAQRIVQWLLEVKITPQVDFAVFGFQAIPGQKPEKSELSIADILYRIPRIINFKWGDAAAGSVVFYLADDDDDGNIQGQSSHSDTSMEDFDQELEKDRDLEEVLPFFPILQDLLDEVRPSCRCPQCQSEGTQTQSLLQAGCLRRTIFQEVISLIAHAIADGFGCDDVSTTDDPDPVIEATIVLLLELCEGKKAVWDTWFSTAACVYLGCPFKHHVMSIEDSGTTYAAIQYGNLSVIARWFDLTVALKPNRSFGLIQGKGTIGVVRHQEEDMDLFQFRGVEEDFAIIQTEHTEDTSSFVDRFPKEALLAGAELDLQQDVSTGKCDVFLVSAAKNAYRFLYRVRFGGHSRVIDPSNAIIRLARGVMLYDCKHTRQKKVRSGQAVHTSFLYTFEDLVGRWSNIEDFYGMNKVGLPMMNMNVDRTLLQSSTSTNRPTEGESELRPADGIDPASEVIHFSSILTSHLQLNIALALAVNDATTINDGSSCLACVQEQVMAVPLPACQRSSEGGDTVTHTVINVRAGLMDDPRKPKSKRKAIAQ